MAPKSFLFVNKHQNSTSLTRNTGDEAQLASKVNKHVQKQRFQRDLGVRKVWYRPFVQSNDTTAPVGSSSSSADLQTTSSDQYEDKDSDVQDYHSSISSKQPLQKRESQITKNTSRSVQLRRAVLAKEAGGSSPPITTLASRPGDFNDPFSTTAVALTATVMELVYRHGRWLESACLTGYAVQLGVHRILSVILHHPVHSLGWLALAATQMARFGDAKFPEDHRPELFSLKVTKMIREYIETHTGPIDPHVLMAAFRLAMVEWIRGNHQAARIHLGFIAQHWENTLSRTGAGAHNIEFVTTEDVYLAVDVDEKPMLALIWEPLLSTEPQTVSDNPSKSNSLSHVHDETQPLELSLDDEAGDKLLILLELTNKQLARIVSQLLNDLRLFAYLGSIDFATAIIGRPWTMRRRMQACLYRLQSLDVDEPSIEACVRRTLIILLVLATTTPARRLGRTNMARAAVRLKTSIELYESSNVDLITLASSTQMYNRVRDPGLWLWISITGYVAAIDDVSEQRQDLIDWFYHRANQSASRLWDDSPTTGMLKASLSRYLFFESVYTNIPLFRPGLLSSLEVPPPSPPVSIAHRIFELP